MVVQRSMSSGNQCPVHSFIPAISIVPFKSSTTQRRSRLQHGYCIGVSHPSAQATAGKGLAQCPYVVARAGVEPTTLRLKVIVSTKVPPRPTNSSFLSNRSYCQICSGNPRVLSFNGTAHWRIEHETPSLSWNESCPTSLSTKPKISAILSSIYQKILNWWNYDDVLTE